jgi:hypothetical protein
MTDLLDSVVAAHGGLKRWNELETVSARLAQGAGEAAVWTTLADAWIHEQESAPG